MPAVLTSAIALLIAAGLWHNAFRAGDMLELRAQCLGDRWRCDDANVEWHGPGTAEFAPRLPRSNRIVTTIDLRAGEGGAWAGLVADDGAFSVGIRRDGDRCHIELVDRDGVRRDPPGWSEHCRAHRLALGFADDRVRVVVDSILPIVGASSAASFAARVTGEVGSAGSAEVSRVFVTRR